MILDWNHFYHYDDSQIQIFYLHHSCFIYCYSAVKKKFPFSSYLFTYSLTYQYRLIGFLFYGLQSIILIIYLILELSQIWPLGAPFKPAPVSWHDPSFEHFLTFWHSRIFLTHLQFSYLSPRISHFSEEPWFPGYNNQDEDMRCVHCYQSDLDSKPSQQS